MRALKSRSSWAYLPRSLLRFADICRFGSKRRDDRRQVHLGERAGHRKPLAAAACASCRRSGSREIAPAAGCRGLAPRDTRRPASAAAIRRGCACLPAGRPALRSTRRSRRGPGSLSVSSRSEYRPATARPCAPSPALQELPKARFASCRRNRSSIASLMSAELSFLSLARNNAIFSKVSSSR